ncbi:uncharacterized protein LOC112684971 [Sipha flava]|uniref:Uncharacterized protein LOC112684971 n=1 Tax=Sipha flava TaxID=143950 RepID=A0A8B8FQ64_9HEMI|nr:uncharacterized protein LOC112684971 [Sipha flava]
MAKITDNKLKVAQLKRSANTKKSKISILYYQNVYKSGKKSLGRKSIAKKLTTKKKSALDKKVVADSKRIDDNAIEGINNGKKINETLMQDTRASPLTYEIIDEQHTYKEPKQLYFESITELEEVVLQFCIKMINQTHQQIIQLKIDQLKSNIDEPESPTDEVELNTIINEQRDPKVGEPDVQTDESKLKIDELEPLHDEPEQNEKINEQNLLYDSFSLSSRTTITDAMNAKMHEYLKTAKSWYEYFQQDRFVLGYLGFTVVCIGINYYFCRVY